MGAGRRRPGSGVVIHSFYFCICQHSRNAIEVYYTGPDSPGVLSSVEMVPYGTGVKLVFKL